jgi:molecular chaperone GrpE
MEQDKELTEEQITSPDSTSRETSPEEANAIEEAHLKEAGKADEPSEENGNSEDKYAQELAEQKDKYIRLYSEFENFRRRTAREKQDLTKTATESMVVALLPILDDFDRAFKNLNAEDLDGDSVYEGMLLIYNKFKSTLERQGVKAMELKAGDEFDTEFQEAITQIPAPDESLKGKVVDVVEKGYMLGEKVVRFAKVVTGA